REPKAFLFDEPLSNLDAKLRTSTRGEIKALHQRLKTTTVYVTHDQEEAMTLGDRIAVLANGVVQQIAPPLEVYQHPVNRFVAGFIGTPAMNFLDGRIVADGAGVAFVEGGEGLRVALQGPLAQAAKGRAGGAMVLGVRPQGIRIGADAGPGAAAVPVELVEPLGEQMDVTLRSPGGVRLVARVPAAALASGTRAPVSIDPSRIHLFEPGEFGAAISAR
ncbi:MAG: TOBE domain-containing protein, partial [Phycisphaerales bacterium]|nr:TOBE domain-containing protein [Phycisphaerales bacterium]